MHSFPSCESKNTSSRSTRVSPKNLFCNFLLTEKKIRNFIFTCISDRYLFHGSQIEFLFPLGSPYRHAISTAILDLQEKTILTELKDKWWKKGRGALECENSKTTAGEMSMLSFDGIFIVLVICLLICIYIYLYIYLIIS